MGILRIHLPTPDAPLRAVRRKLGAINIGLYCSACDEFFALAVEPDGSPEVIELTADNPIYVRCPFCRHKEYRHIANVRRLQLTDTTSRREGSTQKPGTIPSTGPPR